jgi:hypothetical protein
LRENYHGCRSSYSAANDGSLQNDYRKVQNEGANLTNDEKRARLIDLKREHLVDQACIQEILPPEK